MTKIVVTVVNPGAAEGTVEVEGDGFTVYNGVLSVYRAGAGTSPPTNVAHFADGAWRSAIRED